jgi:chloride channel protein, CIC family
LSKREKYYVAFIKWLQRNVGPYQAIITLSVLTGIVTGISAIVLKSLIHYVEAYGVSKFPPYLLFLTPMAGIMIVTLLHKKIFKRSAEFHGVGDIINTISRR